jgi:ribonuclease HI
MSFYRTKNKINNISNIFDFNPDYYVYTDGSCSNNGRKNASAGIGIYFGENDLRNVSKKIEGKQTNNTAELSAIIETFYIIENDIRMGKHIVIVSDSEYAIKCATTYGKKCYEKNWDVDIPNKELVRQIYEMYKNFQNIKFIHIQAHTHNEDIHSIGNYNADKLANFAIGVTEEKYNNSVVKIYLSVPFAEKDQVKQLGGMWDFKKKKWYIYNDNQYKEQLINAYSIHK